MKDKLTFNSVAGLIYNASEIIKVLSKILFLGLYYYFVIYNVKFYFFSELVNETSSRACATGFITFFYPIFIIILTIVYLVCISVYSKNLRNKILYYKLILIPLIILAIAVFIEEYFF